MAGSKAEEGSHRELAGEGSPAGGHRQAGGHSPGLPGSTLQYYKHISLYIVQPFTTSKYNNKKSNAWT